MTVQCEYCGCNLEPDGPGVWRKCIGWEKKATAGSRRGGSDIALRETLEVFACEGCIHLRKHGLSTSQGALL